MKDDRPATDYATPDEEPAESWMHVAIIWALVFAAMLAFVVPFIIYAIKGD